jgi:hypothetical protein
MLPVELFKTAPLKGPRRLRLQEPGHYIETTMKKLKVQTHQLVSDLIDGFDNQLDALPASLETEHAEVVLNMNTFYAEKEEECRGAFELLQKQYKAAQTKVKLNVGGYTFETSTTTLRRLPNTYFYAFLSGVYKTDTLKDGSVFVDRDGTHFFVILNYLRDEHFDLPGALANYPLTALESLKREFDFYSIDLAHFSEQKKVVRIHVIGGMTEAKKPLRAEIQSSILDPA